MLDGSSGLLWVLSVLNSLLVFSVFSHGAVVFLFKAVMFWPL